MTDKKNSDEELEKVAGGINVERTIYLIMKYYPLAVNQIKAASANFDEMETSEKISMIIDVIEMLCPELSDKEDELRDFLNSRV